MESNHFDAAGAARMVDITAKETSVRQAIAETIVNLQAETLRKIEAGQHAKGDVLAVARLAAIMAAKQTSSLIPLCHAIALESVQVEFDSVSPTTLRCRATVKTTAKTGVEMEALAAATIAGLTVYDMCKSVDRAMELHRTRVIYKTGGKSGEYRHPDYAT